MTPVESAAFFASQAELFSAGVHARPDVPSHAPTVLGAAFRASLMVALIRARHGLGDPFVPLEHSVSLALQATGHHVVSPSAPAFPYGTAALIALSVQPHSATTLLGFATTTVSRHPEYLLCALDAALASAFVLASRVSFAPPVSSSRLGLALESCRTYVAISEALLHGLPEHLPALFARAEEFFRQRARDAYFSGGAETDGGGIDNANTIDFRLAFLYQRTLDLGYPGLVPATTAHRWSKRAV